MTKVELLICLLDVYISHLVFSFLFLFTEIVRQKSDSAAMLVIPILEAEAGGLL